MSWGMVVPLDDFIASDFDNYDDILQSYRDENTIFGFTSGLPFNKSTYVYFYNKTMFDELGLEAPTTWEDLVTIGETFMNEKNMVSLGYDDMAGMLEASLRQRDQKVAETQRQLARVKSSPSYLLGRRITRPARRMGMQATGRVKTLALTTIPPRYTARVERAFNRAGI